MVRGSMATADTSGERHLSPPPLLLGGRRHRRRRQLLLLLGRLLGLHGRRGVKGEGGQRVAAQVVSGRGASESLGVEGGETLRQQTCAAAASTLASISALDPACMAEEGKGGLD